MLAYPDKKKQTTNRKIKPNLIVGRQHCTGLLTLQVLYDAPQAVSMRSDEHSLPLFDLRGDLLVPERQRTCDCVLKALTGG